MFAASRFRRRERVVGVVEQALEERRVRCAAGGEPAVLVARPADRAARRLVEQAVGRAGVECERGTAAADDRHVRDPAEVERRARVLAPQPQVVEDPGERGAVAAGGDVARADVGDHRQPGRLDDPRGLPELQRPLRLAVLHPVVDRLPVADHEVGGQ